MRRYLMIIGALATAAFAAGTASASGSGCSKCDGQYFCDGSPSSDEMCQVVSVTTDSTITCPNGTSWTVQGTLSAAPSVTVGQTLQPCTVAYHTQNFCRAIASCGTPDPGDPWCEG